MSRTYFHSPSGTAELSGSERAYAANLANQAAYMVLPHFELEAVVRSIVPVDAYIWQAAGTPRFAEMFQAWWGYGEPRLSRPAPHRDVNAFDVSLNSALAIGGRPLKLLARLHGQCEIHAYVEGANRAWLAGIIFEGRGTGLLREGAGWEDVATLLSQRDDEPVVTSYSVCDQFPNPYVAEWDPPVDPDWKPDWASDERGLAEWTAKSASDQAEDRQGYVHDLWYDAPEEQQWEMALAQLRASGGGLELHPDTFDGFRFGSRLAMWDVLRIASGRCP